MSKEKANETVNLLGDFDPKQVHYFNPKTRQVEKVNPFRVIISQGVRYYEWPKGSGNLWWEDRTFAGALNSDGQPVRGKAHTEWKPKVTVDEQVAIENAMLNQELEKVKKELEGIRREQELSLTHPKASKTESKVAKAQPKEEVASTQTI